MSYFEELCEISESWAKCFRNEKLIRGSNNINYVEAQFLVVKVTFFRRQRQYNFDKYHFKRRLLSVVDGTSDSVNSRNFKGLNFKGWSCIYTKTLTLALIAVFVVFIINDETA